MVPVLRSTCAKNTDGAGTPARQGPGVSGRKPSPHSLERLEERIAPAFSMPLPAGSLSGATGFSIMGPLVGPVAEYPQALLGDSVSGAGDFNGDGFDDLVVAIPDYRSADPNEAGMVAVIFGGKDRSAAPRTLGDLDGTNGFVVYGEATNLRGGFGGDSSSPSSYVAGAGDINGDGFDDIIIGAQYLTDASGGLGDGGAYVIFGRADGMPASLSVGDLDGSNGFKITGTEKPRNRHANDWGQFAGYSVAGAGDFNNDGFDDILLSAPYFAKDKTLEGAVFLIFGKASGYAPVFSLKAIDGTNGIRFEGPDGGNWGPTSVDSAGDFNGDGYADFVAGGGEGPVSVVFGAASGFGAVYSFADLNGANGFNLTGRSVTVAGGGDVNGDGFSDIAVARDHASVSVFTGRAGGFGPVMEGAALDGFQASGGVGSYPQTGFSLSLGGDVNGDGFDDLLIGQPKASGFEQRGYAFVVFGSAEPAPFISLNTMTPSQGFRMDGRDGVAGFFGTSVSIVGDFDADGYADILVGAPYSKTPNVVFPPGIVGGSPGEIFFAYGSPGVVGLAKNGKSATFVDADGDLVTIKTTKGNLTGANINLTPSGLGAVLASLDLTSPRFAGANVTLTAKTPKGGTGDGLVSVGKIDANGVDLGKIVIDGDLGEIAAGDDDSATVALKGLQAVNLGLTGGFSRILGNSGKITLKGGLAGVLDVSGNLAGIAIGGSLDGSSAGAESGLIRASGNIGSVTVKGSVLGGAELSGIVAGGRLGAVKIGGDLNGAVIAARGVAQPAKIADIVAVKSLAILGDVLNALVLAGFDGNLSPVNGSVSIGKVAVNGDWKAASMAAGVADIAHDGFGHNDELVAESGFSSRIASVAIKGAAEGGPNGFYGITAGQVGALKIGKQKQPLTAAADSIRLGSASGNFALVDFF